MVSGPTAFREISCSGLGGRYLRLAHDPVSAARLVAWVGVYAAYGAVDEWLQSHVGRTMSVGDWLADVAGVAIATGVLIYRRRPGSMAVARGEG